MNTDKSVIFCGVPSYGGKVEFRLDIAGEHSEITYRLDAGENSEEDRCTASKFITADMEYFAYKSAEHFGLTSGSYSLPVDKSSSLPADAWQLLNMLCAQLGYNSDAFNINSFSIGGDFRNFWDEQREEDPDEDPDSPCARRKCKTCCPKQCAAWRKYHEES